MTSWKKESEGDVVVQLVVNPTPEGVFDVKACVTGEPPVPASLHPPPWEQPEARATACTLRATEPPLLLCAAVTLAPQYRGHIWPSP